MKEEILQNHDFIYERPPVEWETCVPLANGFIGAALWGDGNPLKISLDKCDVWEKRFPNMDEKTYRYAYLHTLKESGNRRKLQAVMDAIKAVHRRTEIPHPTRLPMGTMEVSFRRRVSLTGRLRLATACFEHTDFTCFVAWTMNVIVLRFRGTRNPIRSLRLRSFIAESSQLASWGYSAPEQGTVGDISFLCQRWPKDNEYSVAWTCSPSENALFITMVSSEEAGRETLKQAKVNLRKAVQTGAARLYQQHCRFWRDFWGKSRISIPDSRLENLYYAELYKLGCNSRRGSLPVGLQGLWTTPNSMPPWNGEYAHNMNTQESYWPVYTSNHLELGECFYETFFRSLNLSKQLGRKFYGADVPLICVGSGPGGEPVSGGWIAVDTSPGGGAWMSHLFWLHWLYSRDEQFLKSRAFPYMRECMNVYLHIIRKGKDGKYHIPFCNTPEYNEGSIKNWSDDTAYDIALVTFLLNALLEAERVLGIHDALHRKWVEVKKNLVHYPQQDKPDVSDWPRCGGIWLAKDLPLKKSHRHHSHLLGLYPLGHLNPEDSEESRQLIRQSINQLLLMGTGLWTGWSFPWASLIAGRADYPGFANQYLQTYLDAFITENSFHTNGDFKRKGFSVWDYKPITLEAGFAAAAGVLELLIQSNRGIIKLFPGAIYWPDAYFENLRAEGAFLVSAQKQDGKVKWVRIRSEKGGLCRLQDPFDDKQGIREFATKPGQTIILGKRGKMAVPKSDRQTNWFGVKKLPCF